MKLKMYPQRWDNEPYELVKLGDSVFINGEKFDFSSMPEGSELPGSAISSKWFMSKVERANGEIVLVMIYPIPVNYSPEQSVPCELSSVPDGPVVLPKPQAEPAFEAFGQEADDNE
jgi:hypothetical protein